MSTEAKFLLNEKCLAGEKSSLLLQGWVRILAVTHWLGQVM